MILHVDCHPNGPWGMCLRCQENYDKYMRPKKRPRKKKRP